MVDDDANRAEPIDADVSPLGARVRVLVVRAREELAIARAARRLLGISETGGRSPEA